MREKAPWIMLIVVLKSSLGVTAWSARPREPRVFPDAWRG